MIYHDAIGRQLRTKKRYVKQDFTMQNSDSTLRFYLVTYQSLLEIFSILRPIIPLANQTRQLPFSGTKKNICTYVDPPRGSVVVPKFNQAVLPIYVNSPTKLENQLVMNVTKNLISSLGKGSQLQTSLNQKHNKIFWLRREIEQSNCIKNHDIRRWRFVNVRILISNNN